MIKAFILAVLLIIATAYTEENHVLVLTAEDLPSVTEEFSHILIEFYAPWYSLNNSGVATARSWLLSMIKSLKSSMIRDHQLG